MGKSFVNNFLHCNCIPLVETSSECSSYLNGQMVTQLSTRSQTITASVGELISFEIGDPSTTTHPLDMHWYRRMPTAAIFLLGHKLRNIKEQYLMVTSCLSFGIKFYALQCTHSTGWTPSKQTTLPQCIKNQQKSHNLPLLKRIGYLCQYMATICPEEKQTTQAHHGHLLGYSFGTKSYRI
jgi:hypothetical protein